MKHFFRRAAVLGVFAVMVMMFGCNTAIEGSGTIDTVNPVYTVKGVSFKMIDIEAVTNGIVGDMGQADNGEHLVSLSAYRIGETEVTQELWEAVMANNPSAFQNDHFIGEVQIRRPVENVNWFVSIAFCNELTKQVWSPDECVYYLKENASEVYTVDHAKGKKEPMQKLTKKGFRLPTEAEWEWAAQGGQKRHKYAGIDEVSQLKQYAWNKMNSDKKTHEVKKLTENAFGLYDMSGNVWEWCWDVFKDSTPIGGQDPTGDGTGERINRGGSWFSSDEECQSAYRLKGPPEDSDSTCGLRLVCRP